MILPSGKLYMNRAKLFYIVFIATIPMPLLGYLDPGSGSMLFSAVIGIVATVFFIIKSVFYKILDIPSYFRGIKRDRSRHSIVFYSEGPQYWNVFMPVIRELDKKGVKILYLSSSRNDPGLNSGFSNVESRCIGEGNKAFFTLNMLSADVLVMTTPGLDVLQIKRSRGVGKYVHITHSSGGVSGYSTFGLDYYDAVLTGGEGDQEFIETIEKVRSLPAKEIVPIGCTYLDVMREKMAVMDQTVLNNGRQTVLISPTWGDHGLLNKYGQELLSIIGSSGNFNVIVRPHPQSFVSEKALMDRLNKEFPENDTFKWDRNPDGLESMKRADIMISDFSGIVFDFIFLFKKPVLTFRSQYDRKGKDSMDYPGVPWNIRSLDHVGRSLEKEDVRNIVPVIYSFIETGISEEVFNKLREGMDKYPMESGSRGAEFIIKTAGEKNE